MLHLIRRTIPIASLAVIVLAGCSKMSSSSGDSSVAATPTRTETPVPFDFNSQCDANDLDSCRNTLGALPQGFGIDKDRKAGTKKSKIHIFAYQGAKEINPDAPPAQPTLILHLTNHGKDVTDLYGLKPKKDAEYDVVVENDGHGKTKWTMWEIPSAKKGTPRPHSHGTFDGCHHPLWTFSIGDFADCSNAPHQYVAMKALNSSSMLDSFITPLAKVLAALLPSPAVSRGEDPAWVSCSSGCCTLGNAEAF